MEEQVGVRSMMNGIKNNLPHLVEKLPEMPSLIYAATRRIAEGDDVERLVGEMNNIRDEMRRSNQRTVLSIIGTGLLMSGLIVYGLDVYPSSLIAGAPLVTWITGGLGAVILLISIQD